MRNTLFIVLVFLAHCASAQKFLSLQYGAADGLPSEQVRDLMTGKHGFIWVATDGGLVRFDGERFVSYNKSLDSYYIKAFAKDDQGRVLFVSDGGLYRIETAEQRPDTAKIHQLVAAQPQASDTTLHYPNGLFADHENRIWISQPDGRIAMYEEGALQFFRVLPAGQRRNSSAGFSFASTPTGGLWAAGSNGTLFHYNNASNRFGLVELPRSMSSIHQLHAQADTLLLAGSGLLYLQVEKQEVESWSYDALGEKTVTSISPAEAAGDWLIGTKDEGLFLGQYRAGKWSLRTVYGANDPHRINRLPFEQINHIKRDHAGNIWLCTAQGLGLLKSRFFETVFGLANNNTLAVRPLSDGRVFISFGDVYNVEVKGLGFYAQQSFHSNPGFITSLAEAKGRLWMGTTTGQLYTYAAGETLLMHDLQDRGSGIFFLESSSDGSLWVCQAPDDNPIVGIARRLPTGELRSYEEGQGLESRILVIRESPRGRLYAAGIGPDTYLYRYQPEEDAFINISLKLPFTHSDGFEVHDLAVDQRGIVWLATTDGLLRYDLERIRRVDLGLNTDKEIRAVATLSKGKLWLSTSTAGVLCYEEESERCTVFDQESGLPSNVGAYRCLQAGADGRIWVGTAEGTVYSRDTQPHPLATEPPMLMSAYIDGQRNALAPKIELPPRSKLKLRWAVPVYPGRGISYRYRLQNATDSTWVSLNTANQMTVPPLNAGNYTWSLQARRPGGYTWSPALTVSVEVLVPWYKRWWAVVLWIVLGGVALYLFERYIIGRLLRRIRVLEERLRIRDLRLEKQESLLEEQSAGLAQQESDLLAISQLQPEGQPHALPVDILHYVSSRLKGQSSWEQVVDLLQQGLEHHSACDALDISWYESEELYSLRLRTDEKRPQLQNEAFDEKSSLAVWVLAQQSSLCLNAYPEEYEQLVHPESLLPFGSVLLVRGEVLGKQPFVLSFMAKRQQAFSAADQQMAELIAHWLTGSMRQPLTKNQWL